MCVVRLRKPVELSCEPKTPSSRKIFDFCDPGLLEAIVVYLRLLELSRSRPKVERTLYPLTA